MQRPESPRRYSTCAIEGKRKRSKWTTSPPRGASSLATKPGGRDSPTYSASTRSSKRRTITSISRRARVSERNSPPCRNAVWGTSSAFSAVACSDARTSNSSRAVVHPRSSRCGKRNGSRDGGASGSPHTHTKPWASRHAKDVARRSCARTSPTSPGIARHCPSRPNSQPWYAHCRLAPRTRPRDSGTLRCGQRSTRAATSPATRNTTIGVPNNIAARGRSRRRSARATAYHSSRRCAMNR